MIPVLSSCKKFLTISHVFATDKSCLGHHPKLQNCIKTSVPEVQLGLLPGPLRRRPRRDQTWSTEKIQVYRCRFTGKQGLSETCRLGSTHSGQVGIRHGCVLLRIGSDIQMPITARTYFNTLLVVESVPQGVVGILLLLLLPLGSVRRRLLPELGSGVPGANYRNERLRLCSLLCISISGGRGIPSV